MKTQPTQKNIPNGWKQRSLESLSVKISDGIHTTPKYSDTGAFYFINGNNLYNSKINISDDTKKVDYSEYLKHRKDLDQGNTILLSINGTIGSVAYYNNEQVVLGKSCAYIKLNKTVNVGFIFFFLNSYNAHKYFISEVTGSTIKNLSIRSIKSCLVKLPPFPEQDRIVAVLETWDRAIEKLTKKIAIKKEIKKWLMRELLTGKTRLSGYKDKWETIEVGKVFCFLKTYAISRENLINNTSNSRGVGNVHYGDIHSTYGSSSIDLKYISVPLIKDASFMPDTKDLLMDGDLIMADVSEDYEGIGVTISVHGLENKKVVGGLHTFVIRDRSKKTAEKYRQYIFLNTHVRNRLRKIANGVSVYGISKNNLSKVSLCLPSIPEQSAIAKVLNTTDKDIERLEQKLSLLQNQKKYLLYNLITGTIRTPEALKIRT